MTFVYDRDGFLSEPEQRRCYEKWQAWLSSAEYATLVEWQRAAEVRVLEAQAAEAKAHAAAEEKERFRRELEASFEAKLKEAVAHVERRVTAAETHRRQTEDAARPELDWVLEQRRSAWDEESSRRAVLHFHIKHRLPLLPGETAPRPREGHRP